MPEDLSDKPWERTLYHYSLKTVAKCQICGNMFELKWEVFLRRFDADGYYRKGAFTCQNKMCKKIKKVQVLSEKGITQKGLIKLASLSKSRKGRTFEELYSAEKAKEIKSKICLARAKQTGTEHDPRLGKKHTDEAKDKMKLSKKQHYRNDSIEKYLSPITGKLVTHRKFQAHSSTLRMNNPEKKYVSPISGENVCLKLYIRDAATKRWIENPEFCRKNYKTGYLKNWKTLKQEHYDSSFELCFMNELNATQAFWIKNTGTIRIEYTHTSLNGKSKLYIPDFIIYTDSSFSTISEIVEVKPKRVFEGVPIVQHKFSELEKYCERIGAKARLVTEVELDFLKYGDIHENQENNT
jgi:hypothetical protein